MDFVANQQKQIEKMLKAIGVSCVEDLFQSIPSHLQLKSPQEDDGMSEHEGIKLMESLGKKNTFNKFDFYLGGGAYEHHIPAIVQSICTKSEFLTSYTPYQAEASQGILQVLFEFQSAICALTGLDAANASLYDGASACAEALLMALRINTERKNVCILPGIHPHYTDVIKQYLGKSFTITTDIPDKDCAAVLVQSPNFFGTIEDVKKIAGQARQVGAFCILCANPLSFGLLPSAKEFDVDIAVGDCQSLGLPLSFGGPYAGYLACRQEHIRQMPGRIVGETKDIEGKRGFVLTLQAREQHIRREKATSNICTSQTLAALASLITILWYGPKGLKKLALTNYQRAAYLRNELLKIPAIKPLNELPHFNEFALNFSLPSQQVKEHFRKHFIEPGLSLGNYHKELEGNFLIAVTETKSKKQLDHYVEVAKYLYA